MLVAMPTTHAPEVLHNITSPWPFGMYRIDILGPFPIAKDQIKFLLVTMDYFTKWIEDKLLTTIMAQKV